MQIFRSIPKQFVKGVNKGLYNIYGGTIHDAKTGKIVAHLQFSDSKNLNPSGLFANLIPATAALSAVNLAVSAIGFTLVISRLKKLDTKLEQMGTLLGQVLERLDKQHEIEQLKNQSEMYATLETLDYAVRNNHPEMIGPCFLNLNKYLILYQEITDNCLENVELIKIYDQPKFYLQNLQIVNLLWAIKAKSIASQNHVVESVDNLSQLTNWQDKHLKHLKKPLYAAEKPKWLSKITTVQKNDMKHLLRWQTDAKSGSEYLCEQYQFCLDHKITIDQLSEHCKNNEITFFVVDDLISV